MTESVLEAKIKELPEIVANKRQEHGKLIADYLPTIEHSKVFCYLTRDDNFLHREPFGISPQFLQYSTATVLIREAFESLGVATLDYPFSVNESESKWMAFCNTLYKVEVEVDKQNLCAQAAISDKRGMVVYTLDKKLLGSKPEELSALPAPLHSKKLYPEELVAFGKLIGSLSSESNLYALANSSSVVFDAIDKGVLRFDAGAEKITGLYTKQRIFSDASKSLVLKDVALDLNVTGGLGDGGLITTCNALGINIIAREDGRIIYCAESSVKFNEEGAVRRFVERAKKRIERADAAGK